MEEKQDSKLKELKSLYSKVVEKFPEIKESKIKLSYSGLFDYVCFLIIDEKKFIEEKKVVIDPSITTGPKFFDFTEEEKETSIAHEIGHYARYKKNLNKKKIKQTLKRNSTVQQYAYNSAFQLLEERGFEADHKLRRLKKWYLLEELYADNKAIEAGYGKPLLKILQKHFANYFSNLSSFHKKELDIRIKNLEEKLKR